VKLTDSKAPEGFTIADGLTDASFAKIDVGSKVQHSYVLSVATATDMQAFEPARVSYAADADGEQQVRRRGRVGSGQLLTSQPLQAYKAHA
jgi:hypothetical protein